MRVRFVHPTTDAGTAWTGNARAAIRAHFGDVEIVDDGEADALVFARFPPARFPPARYGGGRIGDDVKRAIVSADWGGTPVYEIGRKTLRLSRSYPLADNLNWDYLDVAQTLATVEHLTSACP